jgi:cytochrome c biogenesis protein CcdA
MQDVLSLALVVSAIALPDSINPSLILADLYLAAGPNPVRRTTIFAISVFAVTFVGGVLIMLGLAELVRSLLPKLSSEVKYALITAGGVSLGLGGIGIWVKRSSLARSPKKKRKATQAPGQSAVLMGAGIAGVELVTAFPYFAAITIIVGSSVSSPSKVFLLGIYNLAYVLPLIGISIVCAVMGPRASGFLNRIRDSVLTRWPVVVAPLAVVLGIGMTAFGVIRLLTG